MEVTNAIASGELLRFTRGTRQGRAEQGVDVFRQGTDKLGERNIVEEFEHAPLALGRRLSLAYRGDGRVFSYGEPESEPHLHEGHTRTEGYRQAEWKGLDGPTCNRLPVQRDARQATRDRLGRDAERRQYAARRRLGRAEDVGAKIEPVVAPSLRPDPTPESIRGF